MPVRNPTWRNVGFVFRKELTDSLRDRRTVLSMFLVPILLMPLLTIGAGVLAALLFGRAREETPTVMVLGGEDSPNVLAELHAQKDIAFVPARADYAQEISDKQLRAAIEIPPGFDAAVERGEVPTVRVYMYEGELRSTFGADRLQRFLRDFRDRLVSQRLAARQLPSSLIEPFRIEQKNVATTEQVSGALIGGLVPYFIIVMSLTGAMYPAMDLTAGEKERGTIETILSSPVSRVHLVLGKFLMVFAAAMTTAVLAVMSMGVTFAAGKKLLASEPQAANLGFSTVFSLKSLVVVFAMVMPLAVLFSAALLAIALFAKSYREAQSYLSPLTIVVMLPAVVSVLPGVELNAALSLIPVLNTSLVSKEIVSGVYHWGYMALIFGSSCVYAALALWIAISLFQKESVLFRS
jgi:sodium transport system permease protein